MSKITRLAISRKPIDQNKKKNHVLENIFLHLYACFGVKIQNVKNYSIGHKSETDRPKQKKNHVLENIFLHLYACFGVKIQNTNGQKSLCNFLDICSIDT